MVMNIAFMSIGVLRNPKESSRITLVGLAESMIKLGHSVVIITERVEGLPKIEKVGNVVISRPFKLGKIISHVLAVRSAQRRLGQKFDVIHSFSATPLFVLSSLFSRSFARKAKIFHTLRSYSRERFGNMGYFLLHFADAVSVHTQAFKDKISSIKNVTVIRSPLRISTFFPRDKNNLKKEYGYKKETKIIMNYGAVWENKGANNLIKAIPDLIKDDPTLFFLFLPRYTNIDTQLQLVKQLGVGKHVQFIIDDVKIEEYVNVADLIVLPYVNLLGTEGNPSCLLEAMACKTPVVTTNIPELREIAENCVFMAKPGDVDSLIETIKFALKNPSSEMVGRAYQKSKEFDMERIGEEFIRLYQSTF